MYSTLRPLLFALDPETAHKLTLYGLGVAHRSNLLRFVARPPDDLPVTAFGLNFPNPVGLAAGLDKNADHLDELGALGFGFVEVGTTTPRPQPGNPKPRIFRIEQANAMINRLGFNNKGVDHLVRRVRNHSYKGILGINIGKNFDTPIEQAADDYLFCLDRVYPYADYITVNISSPNTKQLRDLQGEDALDRLLGQISERRSELTGEHGRRVPLAVKVAPDLEDADLPVVARVIARHDMDAVIATNTTLSREGVTGLKHADEAGGLSGAPLKARADKVLAAFRSLLPDEIALIGVGGITTGQDAVDKLDLGADLVQFYTGMVYRGPELVSECLRAIASRSAG
jgi:dihydroorotate dehydrogenase